jgi:hypothetical protein
MQALEADADLRLASCRFDVSISCIVPARGQGVLTQRKVRRGVARAARHRFSRCRRHCTQVPQVPASQLNVDAAQVPGVQRFYDAFQAARMSRRPGVQGMPFTARLKGPVKGHR